MLLVSLAWLRTLPGAADDADINADHIPPEILPPAIHSAASATSSLSLWIRDPLKLGPVTHLALLVDPASGQDVSDVRLLLQWLWTVWVIGWVFGDIVYGNMILRLRYAGWVINETIWWNYSLGVDLLKPRVGEGWGG